MYTPTLGRFMQPDPLGYGGDGPNLYAYVLNDPVNFSDPLGLLSYTWICSSDGSCQWVQDVVINGSKDSGCTDGWTCSPGSSLPSGPSPATGSPEPTQPGDAEIVVTGPKPPQSPVVIIGNLLHSSSGPTAYLYDVSFKEQCYQLFIGMLCLWNNTRRVDRPVLPPRPPTTIDGGPPPPPPPNLPQVRFPPPPEVRFPAPPDVPLPPV
jgi:hypothetical protein